jgi:hypothetical protein
MQKESLLFTEKLCKGLDYLYVKGNSEPKVLSYVTMMCECEMEKKITLLERIR